jgi:hypothetical protein
VGLRRTSPACALRRSRAVRLSRAGHPVSPFVSSRHAVARSLERPGAAPFEHRFSLSQRGGSSRGRRWAARSFPAGSLLQSGLLPCRCHHQFVRDMCWLLYRIRMVTERVPLTPKDQRLRCATRLPRLRCLHEQQGWSEAVYSWGQEPHSVVGKDNRREPKDVAQRNMWVVAPRFTSALGYRASP